MKKCHKCYIEKELHEFNKNSNRSDGLQASCRDCQKKYSKSHYNRNKNYYISKNNNQRKKLQSFIERVKRISGCSKCNESRYWVLDFHHINPKEKSENITKLVHGAVSIQKLKDELRKCIVVCANCHRDIHYNPNK